VLKLFSQPLPHDPSRVQRTGDLVGKAIIERIYLAKCITMRCPSFTWKEEEWNLRVMY